MIFATVGTQLPFDRLLSALNDWAARNPDVPVLAQTGASLTRFDHMETVAHLSQSDFAARISAARLVVSHAGMGTILSAAELGKPLILMPRRMGLGEHRTDHQLDTATEMARLGNVTVAPDAGALHRALDGALDGALDRAVAQGGAQSRPAARTASPELAPLLDVIRDFVWDRPAAPGGQS